MQNSNVTPEEPLLFRKQEYFTEVRWQEIDQNKHVNNIVFLGYFDEARFRAMVQSGVDMNRLLKEFGISPVLTKVELEYKNELTYPERIRIESKIRFEGKIKAFHDQYAYRLSDGKLVAVCVAHWFFMDIHKRKPVPFSQIGIEAINPASTVLN
ncbi:thioesterase family protein [Leptospira sp. FAT2]|uniref:acyl-CoA thioesterase n=1 Tax=Leptospira sanjuanensis TaxID=2879643 RepID=UPI001EE8607D|nr:thioesterase family protein [Leptospira sanjuanensis]MCG6168582.1 thioesterase family protein [Leptospira sanjuanensis]MCG6194000.1 thioesterase family protein [Leptospira sanjuanensis]